MRTTLAFLAGLIAGALAAIAAIAVLAGIEQQRESRLPNVDWHGW